MPRLEGRMLQFFRGIEELEHRPGAGDAARRLADAELEGVARRVNHHEGARGDHRQHVALLGEPQRSRQHLTNTAGCLQIRLIGADRADRHDRLETLVESAGVHRLVAAAGSAGDAEPVAVHLGPRAQVIDRALVVVDLHSQQRVPRRPERATVERAVIGAGGRRRVALAGAERIDRQHKKPKFHQPQAAGLHDRVAPCPGPVAVDDQHGRQFPFYRVGYVDICRHPHVGPALEDEPLDPVPLTLERAEDTGIERTGLLGHRPHRGEDRLAKLHAALPPGVATFRRLIGSAQRAALLAQEFIESLRLGLGEHLIGHGVTPSCLAARGRALRGRP